jgi:hypothetical protein
MPIASVVSGSAKKEKERLGFVEKSLTNCPLLRLLSDKSVTTEFAHFRTFDLWTIPRRFSKEERN